MHQILFHWHPDPNPLLLRRKRRLKKNCKRLRNQGKTKRQTILVYPYYYFPQNAPFQDLLYQNKRSDLLSIPLAREFASQRERERERMGTRSNFYKNPSLAYKKDFSLSSVLQNLRGIILNHYLLAVLLRKFQLATKHCFVC